MQILNASQVAPAAGGIYFDPWSDSPLPMFPTPLPSAPLSMFPLPSPRPRPLPSEQ